LEARRDSIHPFCITIDDEAGEYLPHMYGAANYVVIEDVKKLPLKISDIYRRLTTLHNTLVRTSDHVGCAVRTICH